MEPGEDGPLENFNEAEHAFEQITRRAQQQQRSAEQRRVQEATRQTRDETRRDRPYRVETEILIDGRPAPASEAARSRPGETADQARDQRPVAARRQTEHRTREKRPAAGGPGGRRGPTR